MAIKLGQPAWNTILYADESDGFGICTSCELIESGYPELYDEDAPEISCPNCTTGILQPTGDLIITGELKCIDSEKITPSVDIRKFLENLFCDLDYDDAYTHHIIEIKRLLKDEDFVIHHDALRLMLELIHSYDKYIN